MDTKFPGTGGGGNLRELAERSASGNDGAKGGKFPGFDAHGGVVEPAKSNTKPIESGVQKIGKG